MHARSSKQGRLRHADQEGWRANFLLLIGLGRMYEERRVGWLRCQWKMLSGVLRRRKGVIRKIAFEAELDVNASLMHFSGLWKHAKGQQTAVWHPRRIKSRLAYQTVLE